MWVYLNNIGYTSRLPSPTEPGVISFCTRSVIHPIRHNSCHYYNIVIPLIDTGKEKQTCRKMVYSDLWSGWAIARSS